MTRYRYWVVAAAVICAGCSGASPSAQSAPTARSTPSSTASAGTTSAGTRSPQTAVHGNELGTVPVLMYHQLLAAPKGDYDQTPAQFRTELEGLYRAGYRTITAAQLVTGNVDVPAGRSPMVLTFDDSTTSQYAELPDGSVDPASAVGILLAVGSRYEQHPVATFYVNEHPFAGHDEYLKKLHALGMEVGDHTATHANLRQLDDARVIREISLGLAVITSQGLTATTFALPFGAHPHNRALAHQGPGYSFRGVMLVGSNPAKSPYDKGFDPLELPRIRSGNRTADPAFTSTYWLPKLPKQRYVSDGDPATISFPRSEAEQLSPRFASRARPY